MSNSFQNLSFTGDESDKKSRIPKFPKLPDDVVHRFPSLVQWQKDVDEWRKQLVVAMRGQAS